MEENQPVWIKNKDFDPSLKDYLWLPAIVLSWVRFIFV
jgi:hypothetical protein